MNNNEKSPDSIAEEVLKEWERFKINSNEEVPDINAKEVLELLDEISTKVRHEYFGIESVKGINNFCEALKNGEYVIGVDYNPTQYRDIFHFSKELGCLEIFNFSDLGPNTMPPLKLKRTFSVSVTDSTLYFFLCTLPPFDDLIVSHKNNFLDLSNIMPSKFEEVIENLNKGVIK